jgi:cell division protein FtsW
MAVAVNLVPVTGQTLPYISSGGSSVLFTSIALGVILSISWGIEEDLKKINEVSIADE